MSSIVKKLKNYPWRIQDRLGWHWFYSPQQYDVSYCFRVVNKGDINSTVDVVIPRPPKTLYQYFTTEPKIEPDNGSLKTETKFHNQYYHWQVEMAPGGEEKFEMNFQIRVLPQKIKTNRRWRKSDYPQNILNDHQLELEGDKYIQVDDNTQRLARRILGDSQVLTTMLKLINDYVIETLDYGNAIDGLYSCNDALTKINVDCGGFSTLFISLCRSAGIPARLAVGFFGGYAKNHMHAWAEVLLPSGEWLAFDPANQQLVAAGRERKSGRYGFVGSDHIIYSYGSDLGLNLGQNRVNVPILQKPIVESNQPVSIDFEHKVERL